jgi:hypothetical protein
MIAATEAKELTLKGIAVSFLQRVIMSRFIFSDRSNYAEKNINFLGRNLDFPLLLSQ